MYIFKTFLQYLLGCVHSFSVIRRSLREQSGNQKEIWKAEECEKGEHKKRENE